MATYNPIQRRHVNTTGPNPVIYKDRDEQEYTVLPGLVSKHLEFVQPKLTDHVVKVPHLWARI